MKEKPILIHTHFHKRRTGVTRSIENILPYLKDQFNIYIYGYNVEGDKISTSSLLKKLFSKEKATVHCHRNNEILRFLFFRLIGANFKLIATRHAESTPSKFTLFLLKKADEVVTLTEKMHKNLGIKNVLVPHGVDTSIFIPEASVKIDNIPQENIILCAGRVRKAKGHQVLVETAIPILKENSSWGLLIIGKVDDKEFVDNLKKLINQHNLENQIRFIDETPDIISYYQASKIVVVPSFSEGFSLVCAEAMSCECITIATQGVGIHSDLIENNKNGYLFEKGNSSDLHSVLSEAMKNELTSLRKEAREEILLNWSAKKEATLLTQKAYLDN